MVKKTQALQIRLTEAENNAFKALAEAIGEDRSKLARKMIREAINNEIDLLIDEQSLLKIAIRQLIGIANNLNQITTAMHTGIAHRTIDEDYVQEIRKYVLAVKSELAAFNHKAKNRWVKNDAA